MIKDETDLILKTTQIPTLEQRIFHKDALFLWVHAKEQEEWALNRLKTTRPRRRRDA